jgi:hypothetical protein
LGLVFLEDEKTYNEGAPSNGVQQEVKVAEKI